MPRKFRSYVPKGASWKASKNSSQSSATLDDDDELSETSAISTVKSSTAVTVEAATQTDATTNGSQSLTDGGELSEMSSSLIGTVNTVVTVSVEAATQTDEATTSVATKEDSTQTDDTNMPDEETIGDLVSPENLCKGNDDAKFHPLVVKHKGIFTDVKGIIWIKLDVDLI